MALVFVAKDMQVGNPVGHVNVNPLPGLPPGLQYAHLLRHSPAFASRNAVDNDTLDVDAVRPEDIVYTDKYIRSLTSRSGLYIKDWTLPFIGGLTWMVVTIAPDEPIATHRLLSSSDYMSSPNGLLNFSLRPDADGSDRVRIGGSPIFYDGDNYTTLNLGSFPSDPFMVFGTVNGGAESRSVYAPHADAAADGSFSLTDPAPDLTGVLAMANPHGANEIADTSLYMIAQWGRVLSQSEMAAAYTALKPWLLARGVGIA